MAIEEAGNETCDLCEEYRRCAKLRKGLGMNIQRANICGPCLGEALKSIET